MIAFLLVLTALLAGMVGYMIFKAFHDHVRYLRIEKPDEKKEKEQAIHFFFISDIHTRLIKRKTLLSVAHQVDFVLIGGDLAEKKVPFERIKENIIRLKELGAPVYFVWGNNDYELDQTRLVSLLENYGVHTLRNESKNIVLPSGGSLSLIGVDDPDRSSPLMELLFQQAVGETKILLTHRPDIFYSLSNNEKEEVTAAFSGHTHGGQIRFMGLGLYSRGGLNKVDNTWILVSEGYGYTHLPFRLGTSSECHVVTIS
ncbi:metallophosphoesterase [Sediminibacillus massiliensis]|uniref:metallophosphoesterase n=1 Tax=Sediminibacillus massiliensis TaxID=1926277 RepID=UPI0009885E87|nr:metallophosphoesterase [Sediminibacillus massiliensis]